MMSLQESVMGLLRAAITVNEDTVQRALLSRDMPQAAAAATLLAQREVDDGASLIGRAWVLVRNHPVTQEDAGAGAIHVRQDEAGPEGSVEDLVSLVAAVALGGNAMHVVTMLPLPGRNGYSVCAVETDERQERVNMVANHISLDSDGVWQTEPAEAPTEIVVAMALTPQRGARVAASAGLVHRVVATQHVMPGTAPAGTPALHATAVFEAARKAGIPERVWN